MTQPPTLTEAFRSLGARHEELSELIDEIRGRTFLAEPERFAPVPRRRVTDDDDRPASRLPTMAPFEVEQAWRRSGRRWLEQLRRRDLNAVVAALADPAWGPQLARDPTFAPALLPLLRVRQQRRAAATLACQHYPPLQVVWEALERLARDFGDAPMWWRSMPRSAEFARRAAQGIGARGWTEIREEWKLPEVFATSGWAEAVTAHATRDVDELLNLIAFLDAGEQVSSPTPLKAGQIPLIRALVQAGTRTQGRRLDIARSLRRRVGDVFGVADAAHWTQLDAERRQVRTWVANEVLDVLFKHLVPHGIGHHQTEARRVFWGRYAGRVDRIWLLLHGRLRDRLQHEEVRDLLEKVGDMVEVRDLHGQQEQAVVWMHLRNDQNRVVTVIEGNANTTCRGRDGEHLPPGGRGAIDYSRHIVHGGSYTFEQAHQGDWESSVRDALAKRGIRQ